jgi:hypothetical protein
MLPVAGAAGAAFLVVFGGLSAQLRAGRDPALGEKAEKKTEAPRHVLVRRVIEKRVIVRVIPAPKPAASLAAAGGAPVAASGTAPAAAAPGASAPAPVRSAPAPAPAAPAPAPAPVTRSS